jgi:hypothetical protein
MLSYLECKRTRNISTPPSRWIKILHAASLWKIVMTNTATLLLHQVRSDVKLLHLIAMGNFVPQMNQWLANFIFQNWQFYSFMKKHDMFNTWNILYFQQLQYLAHRNVEILNVFPKSLLDVNMAGPFQHHPRGKLKYDMFLQMPNIW